MNGNTKFHKPIGPAFAAGEQWYSCDKSGITCFIDSVEKFGPGKWDYKIHYRYPDGTVSSKDAWCFQIRYYHSADANLITKDTK